MTTFADKLVLLAKEADDEEEEDEYIPQKKEELEFEKEMLANMPEKEKKKIRLF